MLAALLQLALVQQEPSAFEQFTPLILHRGDSILFAGKGSKVVHVHEVGHAVLARAATAAE